jgi:hypothetical protein
MMKEDFPEKRYVNSDQSSVQVDFPEMLLSKFNIFLLSAEHIATLYDGITKARRDFRRHQREKLSSPPGGYRVILEELAMQIELDQVVLESKKQGWINCTTNRQTGERTFDISGWFGNALMNYHEDSM